MLEDTQCLACPLHVCGSVLCLPLHCYLCLPLNCLPVFASELFSCVVCLCIATSTLHNPCVFLSFASGVPGVCVSACAASCEWLCIVVVREPMQVSVCLHNVFGLLAMRRHCI